MDHEQRKMELVRWAREVQLPPEGYEPIPGLVSKRQFGVCVAENVNATPGEPFTHYFSRSNVAGREYDRLVQTLG